MALPTIGTLWIGTELSWLEQLCLQSFLDNGHAVTLFAYDAVLNVPDGVKIEDANSILPADKIIRHARTGSPAYHADVFRLHMLKKTGFVWADTDAYCCKPWKVARGKHFHGWISDDKPLVNNGVLRLPKTSKTLTEMLRFTSDEFPVPPWFDTGKQQELQALKDKGDGVHVSLLPWGVWGPNALTWFLQETGEISHSFPGHVLFPLPFAKAGLALRPDRAAEVNDLVKPDTLSIHFWGRRFRNVAAKYGGVPPEGSFVAGLLARHGLSAEKTAHLMQRSQHPPANAAPKLSDDMDFSMFDDKDVANLVLQRSEVGDAGQAIRDWMGGDDKPLLKFAQDNRDQILTSVMDVARRECGFFFEATDTLNPARLADIGCGYALADLWLYRRYGSTLVLVDIEETTERHFGFGQSGAGYANLLKARDFLEKNGVPAEKIILVNPKKQAVSDIEPVDLAISMASCGFHYPAATYADFFRNQVLPGGGIVLDIRKGSGGIGYMKSFGTVRVLAKHTKYSTVMTTKDAQ